jgi:hypothetical protein
MMIVFRGAEHVLVDASFLFAKVYDRTYLGPDILDSILLRLPPLLLWSQMSGTSNENTISEDACGFDVCG